MEDRIAIGDIVSVKFPNSEEWYPKLEVLYIPSETGDCWHMKNPDSGQIHYIQQFETITLMQKNRSNP